MPGDPGISCIEMRKFILLAISALIPAIMSAQAQITTKDEKIKDFPEKTTRIVLSGNEFFDASLKEEIRARWTISPFEFCTLPEFNELKESSDYYFLIPLKSRFRKESEPGIEMLSLIKGGKEAQKGIGNMLELVSIPVRAAKYPSGREFIFLPALIDIIQEHVMHELDRDLNAYSSLSSRCSGIMESDDMRIVFAKEDLSEEITPEIERMYFTGGRTAVDTQLADDFMLKNVPNTLVSYTVYPQDPVTGSYCYKMLIDAGTHELFYFRKHRINRKTGPGFLVEDIMRITADRFRDEMR